MSLLLLFNQDNGIISGSLAVTEAPDILAFVSSQVSGILAALESPDSVAFLVQLQPHWTTVSKQAETWTPVIKQVETWTPS